MASSAWFINKYGYDDTIIWALYLTSVGLNFTFVFSLPLVSATMLTLMGYYLYEPIYIYFSEEEEILFSV